MKELSVKNKEIINEKSIQIVTYVMYILAMIVFEIGYCNAANIEKWLTAITTINFNFSPCRLIGYIVCLITIHYTKKIFNREAIESFQNKYKRMLIYAYFVIMTIVILIAMVIIIKNPLLSRGMSIGIITLLMLGVTLINISNNALKNIIIINFSLGLVFSITTEFNHTVDEKKHFMSAFNISFGNFDYAKNPISDTQIEELNHLTKFTDIDKFLEDKYVPNITTEVDMNDIPSTPAGYSSISYIFAGAGIFIARIMGRKHN